MLHIHGTIHGLLKMSRSGRFTAFSRNVFSILFISIEFMIILTLCNVFRYVALLVVSVACYLGAFTFTGVLFIWFNPSGSDCGLNVFFLVTNFILAFVFAVIALHPKVKQNFIHCSHAMILFLF